MQATSNVQHAKKLAMHLKPLALQ